MPNLDDIEKALNWLEGLQTYQHRLPFKRVAAVISSSEYYQELRTLLKEWDTSRNLIKEGFQFLRKHFPFHLMTAPNVLETVFLHEVEYFLKTAKAELGLFQQWLDCQQLVEKLEDIGAKEFLSKLRESKIPSKFWFSVLQKGVYKNWLDNIHSDNYELRNFNQNQHEQTVKEFTQLDIQQYEVAIEHLKHLHAERWQEGSIKPEVKQQMQLLNTESKRQKGHQKIRQFITNAAGYQQTFSDADGGGSNLLRSGYFAVILAEEHQINSDQLCIVNDNLRVGSPGTTKVFVRDHKPFTGYNYMLFRIEKRKQQDWESLTTIKELVAQAQDAVLSGEYEKVKKFLLPAIRAAIYRSSDVTKTDRQQMVVKIEDFLRELGLQSVKVQKRSLYSIMQRPLPQINAATENELAILEQFFN